MRRVIGILILTLGLASCSTLSEKQYETLITKLAASPKMQKQEIAACRSRFQNSRQKVRKNIAVVMGVDSDRAVKLFCIRIINGFATNKITYEDFVAGSRGQITPRILKLVQGKG